MKFIGLKIVTTIMFHDGQDTSQREIEAFQEVVERKINRQLEIQRLNATVSFQTTADGVESESPATQQQEQVPNANS